MELGQEGVSLLYSVLSKEASVAGVGGAWSPEAVGDRSDGSLGGEGELRRALQAFTPSEMGSPCQVKKHGREMIFLRRKSRVRVNYGNNRGERWWERKGVIFSPV